MSQRSISLSSVIRAPRERVWAFYNDPANLTRITPPGVRVDMVSKPTRPGVGEQLLLRIGRGPLRVTWEARFTELDPGRRFVDEQGRGPFKRFRHEHRFDDAPEGTVLTDTIEYEPPFGPLGRLADRIAIGRDLVAMLEYRHARTRELLEKEPAR